MTTHTASDNFVLTLTLRSLNMYKYNLCILVCLLSSLYLVSIKAQSADKQTRSGHVNNIGIDNFLILHSQCLRMDRDIYTNRSIFYFNGVYK